MSLFYISDDVDEQRAQGGEDVVVVAVGGELDYGASPQLRERIVEHVEAGRRRLVFDLSATTFIDSTAIGVLVGTVARLREAGGGSLAIVCPEENARILRMFEITGVVELIAVHGSRQDAISALATG